MNYLKESFYITSVSPIEAKAWHAYAQEMLKNNEVIFVNNNMSAYNNSSRIVWSHITRNLYFYDLKITDNLSKSIKKANINTFIKFCQWANDDKQSKYDYLRSIAEKNYPEGTCFACLDTKIPFYMGDDPTYAYNIKEDALRIIGNGGCIYKKGEWAKIIDKNICADDIKKDWQILEFEYRGIIYKYKTNGIGEGRYFHSLSLKTLSSPNYFNKYPADKNSKITKVKRLSDGEVFEIGDRIMNSGVSWIWGFEIIGDNMFVNFPASNTYTQYGTIISDVKKYNENDPVYNWYDLYGQIPNKLKYISMSDLSTYADMIHRFGNDPKKQARINNLINLEIERRIKNLTE